VCCDGLAGSTHCWHHGLRCTRCRQRRGVQQAPPTATCCILLHVFVVVVDVRGTDFESLDADAARKKFKSFVEKWNDGLLEDMYYTYVAVGRFCVGSLADGCSLKLTHTHLSFHEA